MARITFVSGIAVSVLLGIVLGLLGFTNALWTLSSIFLMAGLWTVFYGLAFEREKIFWVGWGAGVAILASAVVLPFSYTVALILIVIIALIIFTTVKPRRAGTDSIRKQTA